MSTKKIEELKSKPIEKYYSIVAMVLEISPERKVSTIKNEDKRASRKVSLIVADGSGYSIDITLWNQVIDKCKIGLDDILLFKNFKLALFRDVLILNSLPFSSIEKTEIPDKKNFVKIAKASKPINGYLPYSQIMSSIGAELRFAWIEGVLLSIEADCCYTRCVQCLKKQDGNSCNLCNTDSLGV